MAQPVWAAHREASQPCLALHCEERESSWVLHIHGNKHGLSRGFSSHISLHAKQILTLSLAGVRASRVVGRCLGPHEPYGEEFTAEKRAGVGSSCQAERDWGVVTVTPRGRQGQQGNEIIGLLSASSTDQDSPRAGEGRQEMHSAGLVLQDKLNGTQSALVTSAHPLGPAQSSLHSLPCGLINLLQSFLSWPWLHHHLPHTPTCQPGTSTSRAEQDEE